MKSTDVLTYKKIISQYADNINFYMKENKELISQMEDLRTTLKINKDLLFTHISSNSEKSDEIKVLNIYKNENSKYTEMNEKLIEEKKKLELLVYNFNSQLEEYSLKLREDLEKSREEIFLLKNKLQEKETEIKLIKREFNRGLSISNIKEISVYQPNKNNLEINNELTSTRELLSKMSKLLNSEKIKNEKLGKKLKEIEKKTEKEISMNNSKRDISAKHINLKNMNDSLLSEGEFQLTEEEGEAVDLDSLSIHFPDKIKSYYSVNKATIVPEIKLQNSQINGSVPKLNLNKIKNDYQSCADVKIKKNNLPISVEAELQKTIDKLNYDLKNSKERLNLLRSKIEKFKLSYSELKEKLQIREESLQSANEKIESLESQLKKIGALTSTEDRSCVKTLENVNINDYSYNIASNE